MTERHHQGDPPDALLRAVAGSALENLPVARISVPYYDSTVADVEVELAPGADVDGRHVVELVTSEWQLYRGRPRLPRPLVTVLWTAQ